MAGLSGGEHRGVPEAPCNQALCLLWRCVPRTMLYDNTRIAVKQIAGDGVNASLPRRSVDCNHTICSPPSLDVLGKAITTKGNVTWKVWWAYARRNFMVPVPRVASWEELNARLLEDCRKRRERKIWGYTATIAERFERDREKLLPLPPSPLEACEQRTTRASFRRRWFGMRPTITSRYRPGIRASPGAGRKRVRMGRGQLLAPAK